jgi:pimeloyl-ACP methyl ester carboxylesterase
MPSLQSNGIELAYETFGRPGDRPLVLVMGLGAQMLNWDAELCEALAARKQYVIRFDNRDAGQSTQLEQLGVPDFGTLLREGGAPPYTLADMAADTVGLLDALGLASAHVCGASMGGMIAQTLAFLHPDRVRSLVSLMSTTGNPELPPSRPDALAALMARPPAERAVSIEHGVAVLRTIGSPAHFDEARARKLVADSYDRGFTPRGTTRQLAAVVADGDRRARLAGVRAPTLVIHGQADPLFPIEHGRDTAAAIPGALLLELETLGHDLPKPLWPRLVDAIASHTAAADS